MSDGFSGSLFGQPKRESTNPSAGSANPPTAATAGDVIKDVSTASFAVDVIQASRTQVVLVDFWAPWCGPCKQLTPILEKVVTGAGGRVRLAKMNIDQHPAIAGQLGVRSIPAVFAFVNGQPVDGFMGALPESEVKAFLERLLGGSADSGDPIAETLEEARSRLTAGDVADAAQLFAAVLQADPQQSAAVAGLAECYVELGDAQRAEALIAGVPADSRSDPAFAGIVAKLKLVAEVAKLGDPRSLRKRLESDPNDHQARFDLALIAQAQHDRAGAADQLLEIVQRDRAWSDDGARRKLLELFDMWGATDPATKNGRRKLSSLLFS